MKTRAAFVLAWALAPILAAGALESCGARTGLTFVEAEDAGEDVPFVQDRFVPVEEDAMPMIDAFKNDVPVINPCPDAAATLIYVIGQSNTLYSFNPAAGTSTSIAKIDCPGTDRNITPFSMAVDREGIAYVIFAEEVDGGQDQIEKATGLYRVSTKTAECERTAYSPEQNDNETFGMGFVANVGSDGGDAGETLFVSQDTNNDVNSNGLLGAIDTESFILTNVGPFGPSVPSAELTGTGDGRLFAFSPAQQGMGESFIAQIDPTNAKVIGEDPLPGIFQGAGWAFGFWGGDFYTFTSTGQTGPTDVNRFDPHDMSIKKVASIPDSIVGAGVSTCAPQN